MSNKKIYRVTAYIGGCRFVKELSSADTRKYINELLVQGTTFGVESL